MKKLNIATLLLVGAALLLASCGKTPVEHKLSVSADTLVFKGNETLTLRLTTDNPESREFHLSYPYEWIYVYSNTGHIAEGDTVELNITSAYLDDPMTIKEGVLYINTAYDSKTVKLVGLPEDYEDYSLTKKLFFPPDKNDAVMHISNNGNTTLDYSITASTPFVSLSSTSGQLSILHNADITVNIDRENLITETNPELYVNVNGTTDTVPLILEKKMMLPNDVVDAEYAKATNLLVYVAGDASLNIFHPDTR